MLSFIRRLFRRELDPRSCPHDWELIAQHEQHPIFGRCAFIRCRLCDWRRIELN